ncbi:CLCA_X family protein [Pseudoalteromonas mariniglutinosa]|uniref:CLCA_X family protein n=1 Tax=Pseudoalteromonas mariniglutinosa TaxID=206042 RepID=UPI00384B2353
MRVSKRLNNGFYRQGPEYRFDDQVDFNDIRDTFGFRTMVVGKWVNKVERLLAANLIYDALADLAQILHLPPNAIGLRGKLNFAFGHGGRKGVQAHYDSHSQTLALAKNAGGGALAHEWFHAFDHHIAKYMFSEAKAMQFCSALWLEKTPTVTHPLIVQLSNFYKTVFLNQTGNQANDYVTQAIHFDKQHQQFYMSMPEELAARCFESCIAAHLDIKNTFLVSQLDNSGLIYPNKDQVITAQEALNNYFFQLGALLHQG